jgi:hypothetical protein
MLAGIGKLRRNIGGLGCPRFANLMEAQLTREYPTALRVGL